MEREPGSQARRPTAVIAASALKNGSIRGLPGGPDFEKRFISDLRFTNWGTRDLGLAELAQALRRPSPAQGRIPSQCSGPRSRR